MSNVRRLPRPKPVHFNPEDSIGKLACGVQRHSFQVHQTTRLDQVTCKGCKRSLIFRRARAK